MTEQDRIVQSAQQNGWYCLADRDGRTFHFAKGRGGITVRFSEDGSITEAMIGGTKIGHRKAARVLQALREN